MIHELVQQVTDGVISTYQQLVADAKARRKSRQGGLPLTQHQALQHIFNFRFILQTIPRKDENEVGFGLLVEENVLFNDALNTFYLRLYGVRHMVKNHSDKERGNPLPPHRLLFSINSKGSFICTIPQTGLHIPQPLLHQSWSTGWNEK